MKRFFLALLFLNLFCFNQKAYSFNGPDIPREVPFTENNITYTSYIQTWHPWYGESKIVYFPENTSVSLYPVGSDYNQGQPYQHIMILLNPASFSQAWNSTDYNPNVYYYSWYIGYSIWKSNYGTVDSIISQLYSYFDWNSAGPTGYDLREDLVRVYGVDLKINFSYNWNGQFELPNLSTGDYILQTASTDKSLIINRSPELGGGVVITLPNTFEYQCGTEGQEECEFYDLPYNSQVTLEAQANTGYAFSHWEINNQTMADVDGTIVVPMSGDKEVVAVYKPVFGFPLSGYASTTVPISAVMDHSLSGGFYSADGKDDRVEAFNGEIGEEQYGLKVTDGVRGYKQQSGNDFLPNYNYPDPDSEYLFYDEHPGFDFAVVNGTNVLAPFAGKLYWANSDLVNGNPATYGTFYIDHENGYTTWFLHCSGLTQGILDQIQQYGYANVSKGDHIAESGNKGSGAYHLHFEVRKDGVDDEHVIDPYGREMWE